MANINLNEKKNSKVFNDFKNIFGNGASSDDIEAFTQILELPDKDFDTFFPVMKQKLFETYNNPAYEAEMLENLKMEMRRDPNFDMDEQAVAAREFLKELDEESLSANKKEFLKLAIENSILKFIELYDNPREKIRVKIQKVEGNAKLPTYAHPSDAGADVYSCETVEIKPGETIAVNTGIKVEIPKAYEIQIRPRSGMSLKTDIRVANTPGTIDSQYRGIVKVLLWNSGNESYTVNEGDKIAQMIISPVPMIVWEEGEVNENTERGTGGFGSSGT